MDVMRTSLHTLCAMTSGIDNEEISLRSGQVNTEKEVQA